MRTTLNLPDGLVAEVKAHAVASGRTFTSVVEEGLRTFLAEAPRQGDPVPLPAFGARGGRFPIDPGDREAVWAALDADGPS